MQISSLFPVLAILDQVFNPVTELDEIKNNNYKLANQQTMSNETVKAPIVIHNNEFAKIFWTDDHQILVTKEYDSAEQCYDVIVATEFESVKTSIKYSFKQKEGMVEAYTMFNQEMADETFQNIKAILS